MENITDTDYEEAKRACEDFRIQNQREYYDLQVEIDLILLWIYWKDFTGSASLYVVDPSYFCWHQD